MPEMQKRTVFEMSDELRKKLWVVDIEGTMMVVAESAQRAADIAQYHIDEAMEDGLSFRPRPPNNIDLEAEGIIESCPWGGDRKTTVAQWIAKKEVAT